MAADSPLALDRVDSFELPPFDTVDMISSPVRLSSSDDSDALLPMGICDTSSDDEAEIPHMGAVRSSADNSLCLLPLGALVLPASHG